MPAKEVVCRKQIEDIVSALLLADKTEDTPVNRLAARASLVEQCKQLTAKETSANQAASPTTELFAMYAFARLKLELIDNPRFVDDRRSHHFLIGPKGDSAVAVERLKFLVSSLEEEGNGRPLIEAGWLNEGIDGQKPWADLIQRADFSLRLGEAKGREVPILQERVASLVLELNTSKLMATIRSHTEKELRKHQKACDRFRLAIGAALLSLATWAVWTPRGGITPEPVRPSAEVVDAVLKNDFPWATAGGGGGGVPGLLPIFRVNEAKLK